MFKIIPIKSYSSYQKLKINFFKLVREKKKQKERDKTRYEHERITEKEKKQNSNNKILI